MRIITLVPYYETDPKAPKFEKYVRYWVSQFLRVCPGEKYLFVTDMFTPIPFDVDFVRVDLDNIPDICPRKGIEMDKKELLALYGAQVCSDQTDHAILVCDADAIFRKNPFPFFRGWNCNKMDGFGMGMDSGIRSLSPGVLERNAGVLYFPPKRDWGKITDSFIGAWMELAPKHTKSSLLGQKAWSLAHFRTDGRLYPQEMNWSHVWGWNVGRIYIEHFHGPKGKVKLDKEINQ